ncbi:MAG: DMT family transporter [Gammaproteobacteria bacterium]|nr:DMT family transporter [Gammaproteobacteria bacterium]
MTSWFSKWLGLVPVIFVLLWSTGFIGAKFALPYIEPFNLLFIRMLMTIAVFALLLLWFKVPMPPLHLIKHQVVAGLLIHGGYLGGVFAAIKWQMPAGVTALLVSMQPLLTALISLGLYRQRLSKLQCLGLALGFAGVVLVLSSKQHDGDLVLTWPMMLAATVALFGITIGSLYQKRFGGGVNLLAASFIQFSATTVLMAVLTYSFETQEVDWQWPLIATLMWLVFGLSVAAVLLLLFMINEGESAKVAAYFYLVPGVTAVEAWLLFDETLSLIAVAGVAISVIGVYFTIKPRGQSVK